MLVELVAACGMGAFVLSNFNAAPAQAVVFVPYGGWVISVVPQINPPAPAACPMHTLVLNVNQASFDPIFGVYVPPGGQFLLYSYQNLFTPGTPLLGGYDPIPFPTCNLPYPVFPIDFNAPFFLTGTGGL